MTAKSSKQATPLADPAVVWLQSRLPRGWSAEVGDPPAQQDQLRADARINLRGPNGTINTIVVEEKQAVSPRSVLDQLAPQLRTARSLGAHLPLLVIAPWLSERTQALLAHEDINYLDLTGNALAHIDNPPFFLQTHGRLAKPLPRRARRREPTWRQGIESDSPAPRRPFLRTGWWRSLRQLRAATGATSHVCSRRSTARG